MASSVATNPLSFDADPALAPRPGSGRRGQPLSANQRAVIAYLVTHGSLTLRDAVRFFGQHHQHNAEKRLGAVLARMERRGLIVCGRSGVFSIDAAEGRR